MSEGCVLKDFRSYIKEFGFVKGNEKLFKDFKVVSGKFLKFNLVIEWRKYWK